MTKPEETYDIKEYSDALRKVEEMEESFIRKEILPVLCQDIAPRLNQIQHNLVLVVEYHPGEPIRVALSREAKISDIADAKLLTVASGTVPSEDESDTGDSGESKQGGRRPSRGLKVTFPDGVVVWYPTAVDTYIATIKRIGYERVAGLGITRSNYNIVSRKKRRAVNGRDWQRKCGGWYI